MQEEARGVLFPDQHGLYRVTSQYYDTPDLKAYWEKIDGVNPRRKIRLRTYNQGPSFLEIKRRDGQTVSKFRIGVPEGLEAAVPLEELVEKMEPSQGLQRFERFCDREVLLPSAVIRYQREAWVDSHHERLRVTFDHFCTVGESTPFLPPTAVVLEIKFTQVLPVWLRELLTFQGLLPERLSKYVRGVDALAVRRLSGGSPAN